MRRAVIFVTLALLLLAVAGVTIAQEGASRSDEPAESISETTLESTPPEATAPETTSPGATVPEATQPDQEIPGPNDQETTKPETPKPEDPGENQVPEEPEADVGDVGDGPESDNEDEPAGDEAEDEAEGQQKVTLCHKGRATISVGAPAKAAHLRHGDATGACDAGSEDAGVPEQADGPNGRGGGPPDDERRPEGAGKSDGAGKKPSGRPRGLDEKRAAGNDTVPSANGNSGNGPGGSNGRGKG